MVGETTVVSTGDGLPLCLPHRLRLLVLLGTGLSACADDATLPDGTLAPIKIALLAPLSGDLAGEGGSIRSAAFLAQQEVNAAGGILGGRPAELIVVDTQTSPEVARTALEQLLTREPITGVLGAAASSETREIAPLTRLFEIPQISCCSTDPELSTVQPETERFLFRTVESDRRQALILTDLLLGRLAPPVACTAIAIMKQMDAYGLALGGLLEQELGDQGFAPVAVASFEPAQTNYAAQVREVIGATPAPDCVVLVGFGKPAGIIVQNWSEAGGSAVQWIASDGVRNSDFPDFAGDPTLVHGTLGTAPAQPTTRSNQTFRANYAATFTGTPGTFSASTYDAAALLMLAIARAGTAENGHQIRDALFDVSAPAAEVGERTFGAGELRGALRDIAGGLGVNYDGASGNVDFDTFGDVASDYEIWAYGDSGFTREQLLPAAGAEP